MSTGSHHRVAFAAALQVVLLLASLPLPARHLIAQATIQGRVHDEVTGAPVPHAKVRATPSGREATTDQEGRYSLTSIPTGHVTLRVEADRYTPLVQHLDIDSAMTVILPLEISPVAVLLDRLFARAPSEDRATGVSKGKVSGDGVHGSGPRAGDAVTARVPGARVLFTGGAVGTATQILLRGRKGLNLPGDPLYYVDGIPVAPPTAPSARDRAGEPSILDLIDPATVDRIEVLSGAAASAVFGLGSNNGVILIYTKR